MTKLWIASILALLCTPARADPSPPTPAATSTMKLGFKIDGGKDQRHYTVELVDNSCGEITHKATDDAHNTLTSRDHIKVCATQEKTGVRLALDWELHDKDRDISNHSEMLLARGATRELDGGTAKLNVTLQ